MSVSSSTSHYELYRRSSIGTALVEALDKLISDGLMEPQVAIRILGQYDRVISEQLRESVRARLTMKGHLQTYRCCDDVWTFIVKDVIFKLDDGEVINADNIKIVACNSKKPQE